MKEGEVCGIGVTMSPVRDGLVISKIASGSPAQLSGELQTLDVIVNIGGVDVQVCIDVFSERESACKSVYVCGEVTRQPPASMHVERAGSNKVRPHYHVQMYAQPRNHITTGQVARRRSTAYHGPCGHASVADHRSWARLAPSSRHHPRAKPGRLCSAEGRAVPIQRARRAAGLAVLCCAWPRALSACRI